MNANRVIANKYRLGRLLGRGGMGEVWSAHHVELDSLLAIKVQLKGSRSDPASERRFRREARAAAELRSPHVVHIYDYGIDNELPYLAMEYLEGENLRERLARCGRLSQRKSASLLTQAARGLEVLHHRGIVHRDIKPSNLFLATCGGEEVLKILDFGIAKTGGELTEATSLGTVMGSPAYLSPEQALGQSVDPRSDVWSLAVVLFRMLTGEDAFGAHGVQETMSRICFGQAAAPSSLVDGISSDVDQFFERALHRDPSLRFQSAQALAEAFSRIAEASSDDTSRGHNRSSSAASEIVSSAARDASRSMSTKSLKPAIAPKRDLAGARHSRWKTVGLVFLAALASWSIQALSTGHSKSGLSPGVTASAGTGTPASQVTTSAGAEKPLGAPVVPPATSTATAPSVDRRITHAQRRASPPPSAQNVADLKPPGSPLRIDPIFGIPVLATLGGANAISSAGSARVSDLHVSASTGARTDGRNNQQ